MAAWIGLTIRDNSDRGEGQFPWQERHYKTDDECDEEDDDGETETSEDSP